MRSKYLPRALYMITIVQCTIPDYLAEARTKFLCLPAVPEADGSESIFRSDLYIIHGCNAPVLGSMEQKFNVPW
jgi:hypothetical protein